MEQQSFSEDAFISLLEVKLGIQHTEEQKMMIKHFDKPCMCFASPGTGKTATAISGLLNAELYKHIPGENIFALSFTKMATAELCVRHKKAGDKLGLPVQTPTFKTLHSLCAQILSENYRLLGMTHYNTSGSIPLKNGVELVENLAREKGNVITSQTARNVVLACRSLNSSMIFDEDHVVTKKCFKDTHLEYKFFSELRKDLFDYSVYSETIPVDDIMLYTLELMTQHPEVSEEFKKKCKVLLVDEAQDLSLLHLRVISLMTDCPILIGDMKQQIYAFNGACQDIVDQFYRLFPNAGKLYLNQSFRCHNEIIDFANKIIIPNGFGNDNVKGVGEGGSVHLIADLSLEELATKYEEDYYKTNNHMFSRNTMFLFRNNASAIPIAEVLFRHKVPVRVNKYQPATELPVIKEMVEMLNLCRNPYNLNYVGALAYLIPELRTYKNVQDSPFYVMLKKNPVSVFEVNYIFKDMGMGSSAMLLLSDLSEKIRQGATVQTLFNDMWKMYYDRWVHPREWMMEYKPPYYINLVKDLVKSKTFDKFIRDEADKKAFIEECVAKNRGIRCYTMHAAKGLEADDIYILDANEGLIPNLSKLEELTKANCNMDAAREIRNERSLCYVAVTRAKDNVYIVHSGVPASMFLGTDNFDSFDKLYNEYRMRSDDITAFNEFVGGTV